MSGRSSQSMFANPRRIGVAGVTSLLVAAMLAAAPIDSAVAASEEFEQPQSEENKNLGEGSPSDVGVALAKSREAKKPVEVKSSRTPTETVFANPDGSLTREVAQAPIRAENAVGDLVSIDTKLSEDEGRLVPAATTGEVSFSADGQGSAASYAPGQGQSVALTFAEELGAPVVLGSIATYPVVERSDRSVQMYARGDGFASRVLLAEPPESGPSPEIDPSAGADELVEGSATEGAPAQPEPATPRANSSSPGVGDAAEQVVLRFDIDVKGLNPSLKDGVLTLTDPEGKVVAQSNPLLMWDSTRDDAGDPAEKLSVDSALEQSTNGGYQLVLRPSMDFLTDPATVYPVTVDPDIMGVSNGDTYYYTDQPSTSLRGQEGILRVGSDNGDRAFRSLLQWNYRSFLGSTVTSAKVKLYQYYTGSATCGNTRMNLFPTTAESVNTWWGNKPPVTGDARFSAAKSFSNGGAGCPGAFEEIDVTSMVNAWGSGHPAFVSSADPAINRGRQGFELRANDELNPGFRKHFCSENPDPATVACTTSARVPTLSIRYAPEVGTQSWYSMTDHQLNDRSSIAVNNKNGNAVVSATDVNVNGLGPDLSVVRTYNSQSQETSSVGKGWSLGTGSDVWLEQKSAYRYDFHAPGGTVLGSFIRKSSDSSLPAYNDFQTPTGGSRADLSQSGSKFTLKFRGSRTSYVFSDNAADAHAYLTAVKDRSGNEVEIFYSGNTSAGKPKMTRIADNGQTLNVTYGTGSSADYVTKIDQTFANAGGGTGTAARDWEYGYNSGGYLTSYTDAASNTTTYDYVGVAQSINVLSTITAPENDSGRAPQTTLTYEYESNLKINQVGTVSYRYGPDEDEVHRYTYDYRAGSSQRPDRCEGNGDDFTVVTDPNNHDTTYCYNERNDHTQARKTWVYDALGNAKSVDYTADNGPVNVTDPSGQSTTTGSTVAKYSGTLADQLESTTEPKSAADDRATTAYAYGSATSNGGSYQPIATKDTSGNCNRYGYDSSGRTTDAYTGISVSGNSPAQLQSAGSCGPSTGTDVRRFHREYNSNGTVSNTWDANAGSGTPPASDQTIYTYWVGGDSGYVIGTAGLLKSIRKPGGDCSATVAAGRSLCTSYAYDGAGRVASITNGNAVVTTYQLDAMDRTTAVYFNGATECNVLTGADCVRYAYDAEGNLINRAESLLESTSFDYDQMNRQIAITATTGLLQPTDVVASAYDGTGRITTYTQSVNNVTDTVRYAYNAANRLMKVIDATGEIVVKTDDDGRTSSIQFPNPTGTDGMKVDYDFTETGKPKSLEVNKLSGASIATAEYNYIVDPFAGTAFAGLVEVETAQMRDRDVSGTLSGINTNVDYSYSKDNRLTGANANSGTDYTYEYDPVGNITKDDGASTTYYGYNRAGELCWQGPNTGTKIGTVCPATPSGNTTLTRDKAGNNTGSSAAPVDYNERDQVTTIGGVDMTYRDLGNDIRATTGATRTTSGPVGITATKTGSDVTFYTRDPNGTILNSHSGTTVRNYVTEYNSSVIALFNPSGSAVASYKYAPYGATTTNAESGGATADNNRFRYISGYQDVNSSGGEGYYKLGARFYDAQGHFTQPDAVAGTINDPKTMTAYNYAGGDPVNFSDPSGYAASPNDPICRTNTGYYVPDGCIPGAGPAGRGFDLAGYGSTTPLSCSIGGLFTVLGYAGLGGALETGGFSLVIYGVANVGSSFFAVNECRG